MFIADLCLSCVTSKMLTKLLVASFFILSLSSSHGKAAENKGNVLFIAPVGSKSHKMFYYGIINALAKDGFMVRSVPFHHVCLADRILFKLQSVIAGHSFNATCAHQSHF